MATDYNDLANRLRAVAHPVRLQILDMLRQGEICVCHIEAALKKRQAYVSQQLMVLRDARLVEYRKDGLQVFYRLAEPSVAGLLDTICGKTGDEGLEVLSDCRCPRCNAVSSKSA